MMIYGGTLRGLSPILSALAFLSYESPFLQFKDEQSIERTMENNYLYDGVEYLKAYGDGHYEHLLLAGEYDEWAWFSVRLDRTQVACGGMNLLVAMGIFLLLLENKIDTSHETETHISEGSKNGGLRG